MDDEQGEIELQLDRDGETYTVPYERREDGWYVNTEELPNSEVDGDNTGFRLFADASASSRIVKQLLRKEFDYTY